MRTYLPPFYRRDNSDRFGGLVYGNARLCQANPGCRLHGRRIVASTARYQDAFTCQILRVRDTHANEQAIKFM